MTGTVDDASRPEDLPEGWEEWLAFFAAQLPRPVDREEDEGSVTFVAGDPGEVIVQLAPHVIRIAEYVAPASPGTTAPRRRWLGRIYWRRMSPTLAIAAVEALVEAARETRHARFRTCSWCEQHLPPERMLNETTCRRCAVESLGPPADGEGHA